MHASRIASPDSPELRLLLDILRAALGFSESVPNFGNIDGVVFQRLASVHKVLPLVAHYLVRTFGSEVDRQRWTDVEIRAAAEAESRLQALVELQKALASECIQPLILRGPLLSLRWFGFAWARPIADLDLLVEPTQVERVNLILQKLGYQLPVPMDSRQLRALVRFRSEGTWIRMSDRQVVDVHWRSAPRCFQLVADSDLWREAVALEWNGTALLVPADLHHFLLLCSHGTQHGWDRWGYIADIGAGLARLTAEDRMRARKFAEASGRQLLLALAVRLALDAFALPRYPEFDDLLEGMELDQAVVRIKQWLGDVSVTEKRGGKERELLACILSRKDRWQYWRDVIAAPSLVEISRYSLPPAAAWVYWVVRGLRLMRRVFRPRRAD